MGKYSFKKNIVNLLFSGCFLPAKKLFSVDVRDEDDQFILKNHVLDQNHSHYKISNEQESDGELIFIFSSGMVEPELFFRLESESKSIRLYPECGPVPPHPVPPHPVPPVDPSLPPAPIQNMNISDCHLAFCDLFPYLYVRPWPKISSHDLATRFITPSAELFNSPPEPLKYYDDLKNGKLNSDRAGMEKDSVDFIDGDKRYDNQFISDMNDFQTFMKKYDGIYCWIHNRQHPDCEMLDDYITNEEILGPWETIRTEIFPGNEKPEDKGAFNAEYKKDKERAWESLFALIITLGYECRLMEELVKTLVMADIIEDLAYMSYDEKTPLIPDPDFIKRVNATIILPDYIFPLPPEATQQAPETIVHNSFSSENDWIIPYAVGDLQMVRYRFNGYKLAEVCHIENVLKGEFKEITRRKLRTISDMSTDEERTSSDNEQDRDNTTTDFLDEIGKTIYQKTSTTDYTNGDEKKGTAGGWIIDDNPAGGSWRNNSRFARDIVSRTVDRIRKKVNRVRATGIVDETEETVTHRFDNKEGNNNIRGIYRWVNKVYSIKTLHIGHRLIIEMNIDNPASFYIANEVQYYPVSLKKPVDPAEFGLKSYSDITGKIKDTHSGDEIEKENMSFYYLDLLDKYGVKDIIPPPGAVTVSTVLDGIKPLSTVWCNIPEGYVPRSAAITMAFKNKKDTADIMVGRHKASYPPADGAETNGDQKVLNIPLDESATRLLVSIMCNTDESGSKALFRTDYNSVIDTSGNIENSDHYYVANIEIDCDPSAEFINEWKYRTYINVYEGFKKQTEEYYQQVKSQKEYISSADGEKKRDIEKQQIKMKCINLLYEVYESLVSKKSEEQYNKPRYLQYFENSLEWNEMTYYFDPDYGNPENNAIDYSDTRFLNFLRAKSARILVPVNPGKDFGFLFYLWSGMLWPGRDCYVPAIQPYLPMVNELKEIHEAGTGSEEICNTGWEVAIPTSMTILQDNPELPLMEDAPGNI